ncbi:MAG: replicative DNA helicase [Clostridia bacterium]|nr:replicative DNA helicase [Clostridia bacterium]
MADQNTQNRVSKIYSFEAEQAVLGSVLLDPKCFSTVAMYLRAEYFYYEQHKEIFTAMQELDASAGKIDILMVLEHVRMKKVFDSEDGGKQYLFQLSESVPSSDNVETYCKIVKDKYYTRRLVDASHEIIELAEDASLDADGLLEKAEQKIFEIRQGRDVQGPALIRNVIVNVFDTLHKLNSDEKELYKGLPTGFPEFDKIVTGLNRSDLVIIGARPAMGKTSFALNMARNVAVLSKKKVVFFSLEMSKEQLAQRVLATEARVSSQKMRTGELTPNEWKLLTGACVFLYDVPLYLDDTSGITVPEMKARLRRMKDPGAVFVDYLQLMQSAKRTESRVQEVSEITRSLKLMAKDLNVPVVVCAQLSRNTESRGNKSHKPQLSDLRESGTIEQDADIVAMLFREDYYASTSGNKEEADANQDPDKITANIAELIVEKNRHGPVGTVKLVWNNQYTMYQCLDKQES